MNIDTKGESERAIWAATYGAEFAASAGKDDHYTRAIGAVAAANAAVAALRLVTRRTGEAATK